MNLIHVVLGWAIALCALATLVSAFMPNVKDEVFDNLSATTIGLLIIQVVVGFFMFTSGSSGLNFFHLAAPVATMAALIGARAVKGPKRKTLVAVAAALVLVAALFSYITGREAVEKTTPDASAAGVASVVEVSAAN